MLTTRSFPVLALSLPMSLALAALLFVGCNGAERGDPDDLDELDAGVMEDAAFTPIPPKIPGCTGKCTVNLKCPAATGPTIITGVVNIPSGNLPLYNAKVYIPTGNEIPPPPSSGASCDRCDAVSNLFSASTDINGRFTLTNVPSGQNIPLIIRVGKWRRVVTIPSVAECTNNPLDADATRLPRNHNEGNIPRIALSTGSADALECILRNKKLGLDDSEFTTETGNGRVNLYTGPNGASRYSPALGGATFTASKPAPSPSWWDDYTNWAKYDIVMLSCEGSQYMEYKSNTALANLEKYIGEGGRVFASHWHNGWLQNARAPQKLQTVATFGGSGGDLGTITDTIDTSFVKGAALADWLILPAVWGPGTPPARGLLPTQGAKSTASAVDMNLTQRWVYYNNGNLPQYFSFNAPIGAPSAQQCGQMVFTDLHVSSGAGGGSSDSSNAATPFPGGCVTSSLSAQEKALIFMLFDLTNCLQPPIG